MHLHERRSTRSWIVANANAAVAARATGEPGSRFRAEIIMPVRWPRSRMARILWVIWMTSGAPEVIPVRHHGNPPHATGAPGVLAVSAPKISVRNVRATATRAAGSEREASAGRVSVRRVKPPDRTITSTNIASNVIAIARCVTTTHVASPSFTVAAPKSAAMITSARAAPAGASTPPLPRVPSESRFIHAAAKSASTAIERGAQPAMRDFYQQRHAAISRRVRAVTVRPMVAAAESRAGDPDDRAEYDLHESQKESLQSEPP